MDAESYYILRKVIIDVVCLSCVGFPILYLFLFGDPYKRGFFCDDESIRHPFHPSTVSNVALYCVGFILPISTILIVEYVRYRRSDCQVTHKFMGRTINPWIWRCYCLIGIFGFGAACSQLLTDIAKYTIGRLRPHFYEICKPDVDCTSPDFKYKYIESFTCTGTDQKLIRESRLSFLSGHSSFSAYTMFFVVLYLQSRVKWHGSHLLRHVAQFICIAMAWGTALSRVSDYKHHWSDVLAGSLLGTTLAVLVVTFVSDIPKTNKAASSKGYESEVELEDSIRASNNGNITVTTS